MRHGATSVLRRISYFDKNDSCRKAIIFCEVFYAQLAYLLFFVKNTDNNVHVVHYCSEMV